LLSLRHATHLSSPVPSLIPISDQIVSDAPRPAVQSRRLVVDLAATSRNWALPPEGAERIRAATPWGWEVVVASTPAESDGDGGRSASHEVLQAMREAEVYFGFGLTRDLFLSAPRLRWVQSAAAGVASLLYPEMLESDVQITNSAGIMGDPIAEQVVAGILYFVRNLDVAVDQQRRSLWNKDPFVSDAALVRELGECRALVVGMGGIGTAVARRLSALGCPCVGLRRRTDQPLPEGFIRSRGLNDIERELPEADIVVLATPLTPLTRGLLSAARLDILPTGAIVVNVARGALLDEQALIERLTSGRLRGAVLDVFQEEPLPEASPLWALRNVLITPHVAAVSPRLFWERELALFLDNWDRYTAGLPLRNLIDKHAGY
jgi:phosphoglycerate dehydrogenase-like enzyme